MMQKSVVISALILLPCSFFVICSSSVINFEKIVAEKNGFKTSQHAHYKRDTDLKCSPQDFETKLNGSTNIHTFSGDPNPTISLTWSGKDGVILALTTMSMNVLSHPSKLYRSNNRGKSFVDISSQLNNDYIRKVNGILVNPADSSHIILLGYNSNNKIASTTNIYVSSDAGSSFRKSVIPFIINDKTVKFQPKNKNRVLALSNNQTLWMSLDYGISWKMVAEYVPSASWDPLNADILYYTFDPEHKMQKDGIENELYRYNVAQSQAALIAQHVHSFVVQDDFLLLSVQFTGKNGSRVLHVSKNEGHAWNAAQLPMIGKEEFYSLLDMSENMVFVHVDTPGDTGHGNIYTSDERGIVYSLSLERHLYPNNKGITDFYKVNSLPGVYITTQLGSDTTVHSRITFDKGGAWQPVSRPLGSKCPPTEQVCNLQIHNTFSASKGVTLPSLPLSSKNTVGLIMAHGNLGDGLSFHPPDVYITGDGGYTWTQPEQLKGPHFYGIGDSGGILFAVPSTSNLVDSIQYSLDEGSCWYTFNFSSKKIRVTGISAEPGESATDITIWGWDQSGDGSWLVYNIDFKSVLGTQCQTEDYITWHAHESNSVSSLLDGNCMLGAQRTFLRRKKGTVCLNGDKLVPGQNNSPCECQKLDYLCDYGYKRNNNNECVEDHEGRAQFKDICINDSDELITSQGYRKIPGDLCEGGFEPPRSVVNLHKKCAKTQITDEDFGVDPNQFVQYTNPSLKPNHPQTGLIIFLVIAVLTLGAALSFILYKRRASIIKVRYTPLSTNDDEDQRNSSLVGTKTVLNDETVLSNSNGSVTSHPAAVISYHDDSDDDLLVT